MVAFQIKHSSLWGDSVGRRKALAHKLHKLNSMSGFYNVIGDTDFLQKSSEFHTCTCIHMCTHMHTHTSSHTNTHTCTHTSTCTHTYKYINKKFKVKHSNTS